MFLLFVSAMVFVIVLLISVYQGTKILNNLVCNWSVQTTSYKVKYSLLFAWDFILIAWSVFMLCSIYSTTVN